MKKNPGSQPLLHSDRGFQYTSHKYQKLSRKYQFSKNMSRVSRCLDNQPIERFWGTFKEEKFYRESYSDFNQVKYSVSCYIRYYNNCRYAESLNELSPNEFRKQAA